MLRFQYDDDGKPQGIEGEHDDLVMAAAITYAIRHQQRMNVIEKAEPPREKLIDRLERQQRRRRF